MVIENENNTSNAGQITDILLEFLDNIEWNSKIMVVATAEDSLRIPSKLLQVGYFHDRISINSPNRDQRAEIIQCHLLCYPWLFPSEKELQSAAESIANMTPGFVGRDLKSLCRKAYWKALERRSLKEQEEIATTGKRIAMDMVLDIQEVLKEFVPSQMITASRQPATSDLTWSDFAGYDAIKLRIQSVVEWPIHHPYTFTRMGIEPPRGLLLFGPPGCGKSLITQILAKESHISIMFVHCADIFSKYLGDSELVIRQIFEKARRAAPCLLILDELESIAFRRGFDSGISGNTVEQRVLSQLLNEMDGIQGNRDISIVACTNRPDLLDEALLRPGRLEQHIHIPLPTLPDRMAIIKYLATKSNLDCTLEQIEQWASNCEGLSGADMHSLYRNATILALRRDLDATSITTEDFDAAFRNFQKEFTHLTFQQYQHDYIRINSQFYVRHQQHNLK